MSENETRTEEGGSPENNGHEAAAGLNSGYDEAGFETSALREKETLAVKDKPVTTLGDRGLDFILDIPLEVTVEVGRTRMEIGELLALGPGSVVELDKLAGEPLEIYVNNKLVANGEAVVVNEKFGVRLTSVVSKTDRIEGLGN